jgi:hypothetical protein
MSPGGRRPRAGNNLPTPRTSHTFAPLTAPHTISVRFVKGYVPTPQQGRDGSPSPSPLEATLIGMGPPADT